MGKSIGVNISAAIKKAAVWSTPVACGAGNGVLIQPPTMKLSRDDMVDDSLGTYFAKAADMGQTAVGGVSIPAYLRYDSLDLLIGLAMGATGGAPVQQGATAAYAQSFTLADSLDGLFGTFAVNKDGVYVEELPSLKITGFTIKGEVGKPVQITFEGIANDKRYDSVTNTGASFANVTYTETENRVLYRHCVMRMNAQSGGALAAGDKIYPSSFELSFKRAMSGVYGVSGFDTIDEPTNDGKPEVTLRLEFPRDTAATLMTDFAAGNAKKMDIVFTGGLIADTYYRTFKMEFPNLHIKDADAPVVQGIIKQTVDFDCLGCAAAPTGMAAITKPFKVSVINQQTANVLA